MLQTLSRAGAARDWLLRIAESECHPENVVYTYWLGGETLGAVLANTRRRPMRVVSRAHGHDLYEERHDPPYLPFRNAIFRGVTAVYPVSEDGAKVLQARWPGWADRIRMARLGVADPSHDTPPSHDGVLRVVSCSFLVPVKRVELLVTALACLGAQDPALRVEWTHLGDGPLSDAIQRLAENSFTPNIGARFLGHLEHREVLDYFRSNPVDVFVNVSSSEGVPVSIMEAQSFGIPVVATAVGGTPEIVSDTNGILLPKNAEVEEVARAIGAFRDTGETVLVRRRKSKEMWRERYDADRNFPNFARRLTEAASAGPIRLALAEGER
jgi:glycosyltransferase involved in cell wall biosynthesis